MLTENPPYISLENRAIGTGYLITKRVYVRSQGEYMIVSSQLASGRSREAAEAEAKRWAERNRLEYR